MIRRPPRSTLDRSSAASDVYKRQSNNCFSRGVSALCLERKNITSGSTFTIGFIHRRCRLVRIAFCVDVSFGLFSQIVNALFNQYGDTSGPILIPSHKPSDGTMGAPQARM